MKALETIPKLRLHGKGPCEDAVKWLTEHPEWTVADAWDACDRADWMLWYVSASGVQLDDHSIRVLAVEWSERAYRYWLRCSGLSPDSRSEDAIRVAWRYLRGQATRSELRDASADAAHARADAAFDAGVADAAALAAHAHADDVDVDDADAAALAAHARADAAFAAYAATASADDAATALASAAYAAATALASAADDAASAIADAAYADCLRQVISGGEVADGLANTGG